MDIFETRGIQPMLIKDMVEPFSDPDWIYELKLDGIRCIAYLDKEINDLRNRRGFELMHRFPELSKIHLQVKQCCVLDGELLVINEKGVPDFDKVQRRCVMSDSFKIKQAYEKYPATFVAYDIVYLKDREIINLPLMQRKVFLSELVQESGDIAVSRYIEEYGESLFAAAVNEELEGVVAKRKDSNIFTEKEQEIG